MTATRSPALEAATAKALDISVFPQPPLGLVTSTRLVVRWPGVSSGAGTVAVASSATDGVSSSAFGVRRLPPVQVFGRSITMAGILSPSNLTVGTDVPKAGIHREESIEHRLTNCAITDRGCGRQDNNSGNE